MDLGLKGRTALITGGSRGIGLATGVLLAAEGCRVILVARDAAKLAAAAAAIREGTPGTEVTIDPFDVAVSDAADQLAERHGAIDILINNAGAIPGGSIDKVDKATWRKGWDLKVFGTIALCRAFHALMSGRGSGVIVNVIGWAGERVDAGYIAGSAGNAALMALTRALGSTSPRNGVRVVGINPGPISTGRLEVLQRVRAQVELGDAERWRELVTLMPFGRAGRPEEIAAAVAFLASDHSAYTSGTVLTIDGGLSSRA